STRGVRVGERRTARRIADRDGAAEIRGAQHLLALRDDSEQGGREDFKHVLDREHLAARGATRVVAGQQKVFVDALASFGLLGLGVEQPDYPIRVSHGGYFGIGYD